ncbi:MAG TPA: glycoside hydrolase family 2 TIM barrel-domain containing protein [Polyangiaceae bacterium]|nr:glycoside hydrolase family 2 TIM barrel-domain containing protein [Polyangiaceae bacterium]
MLFISANCGGGSQGEPGSSGAHASVSGSDSGGRAGSNTAGSSGGSGGRTNGEAGSAVAGESSAAGALGTGGAAGNAGSAGAAGGSAGMSGSGYQEPPATRADLLINGDWKFLRKEQSGAQQAAFDDASWTAVSLPHTWNASDGQDGGNNYYRGIAWYRRHYTLPAEAAGKRVYLQFDGANVVADVYVNGTLLGQHRGGFARFRYDATAALKAGADNVIAVKVSNANAGDVPPLDADFTFFGGLYRDAHVLISDPVHIDVLDYASSGVYLDTSEVTAASAKLRARVRVQNDSAEAQAVTVTTTVVRQDGSVETTLSATASVPAGKAQELASNATIANPHLWNGVEDPYLYTAYVQVQVGSASTDWVKSPLGFRFFSVDPAQGFSLNGKYLDLHGVNRHQDRLNMGWAISNKEHDQDMALIREMGATVIRLSHYEQAEHFHDLADHNGTVLWAEIPLVNAISNSSAFTTNATQQLTELIRQNYNHPSIIFWGIGNEQRSDNSDTNALLTKLNTLVHTEDPSRLSTYAACCTSDTGGLPAHSDVVGYNTYYGWYDAFGTSEQFGAWADKLHAAKPTWKIGVSEYGAGAGITQHADNPTRPDPYGTPHPEEWQNLVHESHWRQMKTRRYLWSKIIWNMFDFAVDSRDEGDTKGRNDKGLVTYDRAIKKDAFYWYKANWTTTPVVYITSHRFTSRSTATVPVKVYTNLDSVSLEVNGVAVAAGTSADHVFSWTGVALRTGANTIVATGKSGASTITDTVTWTRM